MSDAVGGPYQKERSLPRAHGRALQNAQCRSPDLNPSYQMATLRPIRLNRVERPVSHESQKPPGPAQGIFGYHREAMGLDTLLSIAMSGLGQPLELTRKAGRHCRRAVPSAFMGRVNTY
jgi:hypothetical protein